MVRQLCPMLKQHMLMRALIIGTAILVAGGAFLVLLSSASEPAMLSYLFRVFGAVGKQRVLHLIDHQQVAEDLRVFAHQNRWDLPSTGRPVTFVPSERAAFPQRLKALRASSIRILDDRVELEFGGTPLHYGIAVFREGNEGRGLRRLGDGVWFYSEDSGAPAR